jgi:hypothetical protein
VRMVYGLGRPRSVLSASIFAKITMKCRQRSSMRCIHSCFSISANGQFSRSSMGWLGLTRCCRFPARWQSGSRPGRHDCRCRGRCHPADGQAGGGRPRQVAARQSCCRRYARYCHGRSVTARCVAARERHRARKSRDLALDRHHLIADSQNLPLMSRYQPHASVIGEPSAVYFTAPVRISSEHRVLRKVGFMLRADDRGEIVHRQPKMILATEPRTDVSLIRNLSGVRPFCPAF